LDFTDHEETLNETHGFSFVNNIDIPYQTQEYIRCGTLFSASEVFALGKKDFHGTLGPFKKYSISLSKLEPLSFAEARYMSAVVTQLVRSTFAAVNNRMTIIHCEPTSPSHVRMMLLYPEVIAEKKSLRILQIRDDDGQASKKSRLRFEEGSYTAGYDILKGLVSDNNNTSNDVTSLKANFCWPTSRNQMDAQPPHSSKSILQVKVALGEQQSPLNEIFLELTSLDSIANTTLSDLLSDEGTISLDMDRLYENLTSFKETVSNFSFYGGINESEVIKKKSEEEDDDDSLEKPMSQLIRQKFIRSDYDFTDKLWLFLRNADSGYQEMKFYLDDVINDIVQGSLQPAVSPMNATKLAKLVRKMYTEESEECKIPIKEKILEFLSNDSAVVNLIVEIGFEKIRKDYYHYFLTNELTIITALEKIRGKQPMGQHNHANDISFLWKLHCCLEVVITPTVYLRLDHDSQRSLLNAALEYYTHHVVTSSSPVFCLSLLPLNSTLSNVLNSCTTRLPDLWKEGIVRLNKGGLRETCIVCQQNSDSIVDDDVTSSSLSTATTTTGATGNEKEKVAKLPIVLTESVIEIPN